jgi:uncharacterized protein (DUF58 family)
MIVPTNRLLFWMAALLPFAALGALAPSAAPVSLFISAMLAITAATDALIGFLNRRGIHITLPEVTRLSLERKGAIPVLIRNDTNESRGLRVGLPLPESMHSEDDIRNMVLPDGVEHSKIAWDCTPRERGTFILDRCYFETPSPLGFWGMHGASPCHTEIRVYPNLMRERKRLAATFLRRGYFGVHAQRMVGQGREFEKLREYTPGDSYEDIHWKTTAKRGRPITKLFQIERTREIYVLIDSSRLSARESGAEPALERFLTASLIVGLVAEQQGDLFGVLTFSDKVKRFIRAGCGKAHYNICRDAVYSLNSEITTPDFGELFTFVRLKLRRRALLLILTDLGDPVLAESFLQNVELINRQHVVVTAMIRPPGIEPLFSSPNADDTDGLYRSLAGHMIWHDLRELQRRLQHHGVRLSIVENERLPAELASQYMAVKTRQLL